MIYQNEWINHLLLVRGFSKETCNTYEQSLRKFDLWRATSSDILNEKDLTPEEICNFMADCTRDGLAPATVNLNRCALQSYYSYCCAYKGYPFNPVLQTRQMKMPRLLPDYVPMDDIESVLTEIPTSTFRGLRARSVIVLLTHCGLRCSELINLRLTDLRERRIIVYGKGSKQRIVPLSNRCLQELDLYMTKRNQTVASFSEYIFCREDGSSLTRSIVYKIVHSSFAGSPSSHIAHPHALRHTFATVCCLNGVPIPRLQHLMGHTSPSTTFRYLSLVPDDNNPFDTF